MPANKLNDPEFWRFRAEEARTLADDMKVTEPRRMMLRIAEDYEKIAKFFEQQTQDKK